MSTSYMPVFLELQGRLCVVVGGGPIGVQKAVALAKAGARVTVIDPDPDAAPEAALPPSATRVRRAFEAEDAVGATLVIAATDDRVAQNAIRDAAHAAGALVNVVDVPELCDFIYGATLERGDLQIAVSTSGRFPTLAARIRDWIGALLPASAGSAVELLGRARAWLRDVSPAAYDVQRERLGELVRPEVVEAAVRGDLAEISAAVDRWTTAQAASMHAGAFGDVPVSTTRSERPVAPSSAAEPSIRGGVVYLVGGGPGDPSLLTLRAAQLIKAADVVFHDALISDAILSLVPPGAARIPVGRRKGRVVCGQDDTLAALVEWSRRGAVVVRLKGGDPLVFGRAGEEIDALRAAAVPFEVVPGVTAASAAAAALGLSLTRRGEASSLAILSGHAEVSSDAPRERARHLQRIGRAAGTLAIYMGATRAAAIGRTLIAAGRSATEGVAVVERASLANQRVHRMSLGDLARRKPEEGFEQPALLLIGPTLSLEGADRSKAKRATRSVARATPDERIQSRTSRNPSHTMEPTGGMIDVTHRSSR
jgi:uroporphyrin-III C-methyltransferase/precorrin-2 dehydrogenase/sirohydrochlorin ferrochelatase